MTAHRFGTGVGELALVGLLVILWAVCCLLVLLRDAYRDLIRSTREECDDLREHIRITKERQARQSAGQDFIMSEFVEDVLHQPWWQDKGPTE